MTKIKQVIIPIAGLGTRFFPLSKVLSKELLPVADKLVLQYLLEEVSASGIKKVIFVAPPGPRRVLKFLKRDLKLEKLLEKRNKNHILDEVRNLNNLLKDFSFSFALQKKPLGDGHAILQAKKIVKDQPCAILFCDDIIDSKTPAILQLINIFKTCQKPVIALKRVPQEKLSHYGVVQVEKIANRLYKIKKIIEKPPLDQAPSDLAIPGRHIITSEVFEYLEKAKPSQKGEIHLSEVLDKMATDGKIIYGYEIEGKWLECGDKLRWLRSNLYFSLKHPRFGPELRRYLREII